MNKKILITGFAPFDSDNTNPSGDWIVWMKENSHTAKKDVRGVILPVTFHTAFDEFKKHFDEFCPDIVLLTGLAKNRKNLTIERIGINWVDARIPDNDGVTLKAQKINPHGPDGVFTTIDLNLAIRASTSAGEVMTISTSAGEYVCNDILYKALCYVSEKKTPTTFIHIPGRDSYDGIYLALLAIVNRL